MVMTRKVRHKEQSKRKRVEAIVFRPPFGGQLLGCWFILVLACLLLNVVIIGAGLIMWIQEGYLREVVVLGLIIGAFLAIIIAGFFWQFGGHIPSPVVAFSLILDVLFAFCWSGFRMYFNRLIVSPAGIEYHIDGRKGFAFWHDMEYLGFAEKGSTAWGIVLNRHVDVRQYRLLSLLRISTESDYLKSLVPISPIDSILRVGARYWRGDPENFRSTPLGQAIMVYAPHLFRATERRLTR